MFRRRPRSFASDSPGGSQYVFVRSVKGRLFRDVCASQVVDKNCSGRDNFEFRETEAKCMCRFGFEQPPGVCWSIQGGLNKHVGVWYDVVSQLQQALPLLVATARSRRQ